MEEDSGEGPSTGNTGGGSLPPRRSAPPLDPDDSDGFNNDDNVAGPLRRPPRRLIGRPNVSLKGSKRDDDYVNNRYARIIAVFFTNIFINLI